MDPRNKAVLRYLEVGRAGRCERARVIAGSSLSTRPDLCERIKQVNEAVGEPTELRYHHGKPTLTARWIRHRDRGTAG